MRRIRRPPGASSAWHKYDPAAKPKSDLYRDLLPLINGRRVDLLDQPRPLAQLYGLEHRIARGGCDGIDHAPAATTTWPTRWPALRPLPLQQHDGLQHESQGDMVIMRYADDSGPSPASTAA